VKNMAPFIIFAALCIVAAFNSGCQTAATGNNSANKPPNTNEANTIVPKSEATPTQTSTGSVGSLATPTDAYKTAYELRKKKDIEGLKKIMSKDIIEFLTMMGEADKKTLDDMLKEMVEKPQADKVEVRNEKVDGDSATIEYLTETGGWKTMDFERVGSDWMLSFPKASKDDIKSKMKP
jgi:hypothetical protein